jgi:hypothetical protein
VQSVQQALKDGTVGPKAEQYSTKMAEMLKSKITAKKKEQELMYKLDRETRKSKKLFTENHDLKLKIASLQKQLIQKHRKASRTEEDGR